MQDSLFNWKGPFPYDLLSRLNITPDSTLHEIKEVGFDVQAEGTPEELDAWNELRLVRRRLFIDFFLYQLNGDQWPDLPDEAENE
jgi:hypothetical protein